MFFISLIQNKDGFLCHGFLLDSKILYLEPKHTIKDFEMVKNKVFNNMRTLKFKAQPTNLFFSTVNQMFGGSSQLLTMLSELCSTI